MAKLHAITREEYLALNSKLEIAAGRS